jgi:PKD repeat protein
MALRGTDLAILSCRFGVARFGASRFGFCPDHVEGTGNDEPGEYVWKEDKPPTTLWVLQSLYSHCGERPVASFTDLPDPTAVDDDVQFTDTSTPEEFVTFWLWDFGDGNTSLDQHPVHAYAAEGVYTVTLWVSGPHGAASATGTHTVSAGPTAGFTWSQPAENDPTEFTDTSVAGGWALDTWSWDFGDATGTSTEQNPTYVYASSGDYTVTLTVTDTYGNTDQFQDIGTI